MAAKLEWFLNFTQLYFSPFLSLFILLFFLPLSLPLSFSFSLTLFLQHSLSLPLPFFLSIHPFPMSLSLSLHPYSTALPSSLPLSFFPFLSSRSSPLAFFFLFRLPLTFPSLSLQLSNFSLPLYLSQCGIWDQLVRYIDVYPSGTAISLSVLTMT